VRQKLFFHGLAEQGVKIAMSGSNAEKSVPLGGNEKFTRVYRRELHEKRIIRVPVSQFLSTCC
jgi:hypothetical protein